MARGKKHTPDQIPSLLRQAEIAVASRNTSMHADRRRSRNRRPIAAARSAAGERQLRLGTQLLGRWREGGVPGTIALFGDRARPFIL